MSVFLIAGIWVSASLVLTPFIGILLQRALRDSSGAPIAYAEDLGLFPDLDRAPMVRPHSRPAAAIFSDAGITSGT